MRKRRRDKVKRRIAREDSLDLEEEGSLLLLLLLLLLRRLPFPPGRGTGHGNKLADSASRRRLEPYILFACEDRTVETTHHLAR